jgi:hypothetical protein
MRPSISSTVLTLLLPPLPRPRCVASEGRNRGQVGISRVRAIGSRRSSHSDVCWRRLSPTCPLTPVQRLRSGPALAGGMRMTSISTRWSPTLIVFGMTLSGWSPDFGRFFRTPTTTAGTPVSFPFLRREPRPIPITLGSERNRCHSMFFAWRRSSARPSESSETASESLSS